jgi:hypothetical protein
LSIYLVKVKLPELVRLAVVARSPPRGGGGGGGGFRASRAAPPPRRRSSNAAWYGFCQPGCMDPRNALANHHRRAAAGARPARATREKVPENRVADSFRETTRRRARAVERRRGGHDIISNGAHDQDGLARLGDARNLLLRRERFPARDQSQARAGNVEETRARLRRSVAISRFRHGDFPYKSSAFDAPLMRV